MGAKKWGKIMTNQTKSNGSPSTSSRLTNKHNGRTPEQNIKGIVSGGGSCFPTKLDITSFFRFLWGKKQSRWLLQRIGNEYCLLVACILYCDAYMFFQKQFKASPLLGFFWSGDQKLSKSAREHGATWCEVCFHEISWCNEFVDLRAMKHNSNF